MPVERQSFLAKRQQRNLIDARLRTKQMKSIRHEAPLTFSSSMEGEHPPLRRQGLRRLATLWICTMLSACSTTSPELPRASKVDISRFMGDWYVIAHIPTYPEKNAFNAIESYELRQDGRIATRFRYRDGSFDAPEKTMNPVGTVMAGTFNAVWDMQFIWPFQAEYVVADVSADYQTTIIARSKRDYVWLMARTPQLAPRQYAEALDKIKALGYDLSKIREVPQSWPQK